nr:efflux transporter outer membrane subunit [Sphingobium sp. Sx8-8]
MTSACVGTPHMAPPTVSRVSDLQSEARSLAGTTAQWPGDGWWKRYGDLQLDRLIGEALATSPDLAASAARIRVADGFARQAGAALFPSVTANGAANEMLLSKNNGVPAQIVPGGWNDTGSVSLGATLDLDLWGKNRATLRAAKLDAVAVRYEAEQAKLALTTGIAAAYAELAALHAQHDSLETALTIRSQMLRLVEQRVTRGLETDSTLAQARARLEIAQANLAATDEAIGLARNAVAALVGRGPDRALTIERPDLRALDVQALPANASIDLLGRRPDVSAAKVRAEAAQQMVNAAKADFYPNVSLTGLAGFQAFGLDNLFKSNSPFGAAGPAVSLPLFRGGALQGQYRARRGQYDEAIAAYDHAVVEALHQTADAMTSRTLLVTRLQKSRSALTDFEAASRLARLRYSQGLSTYLDVLSAEEGVLESRLTVARLQTRAFALDVALVRALGGGFQS